MRETAIEAQLRVQVLCTLNPETLESQILKTVNPKQGLNLLLHLNLKGLRIGD